MKRPIVSIKLSRILPNFTIILPICGGKVSISSDLHHNLRVRIPTTARQSGSEIKLVVSTFITLISLNYFKRSRIRYKGIYPFIILAQQYQPLLIVGTNLDNKPKVYSYIYFAIFVSWPEKCTCLF